MEKNKFLLKNMPRGSRLAGLADVYPQADLVSLEVFGALLEVSSEILSAINAALAKEEMSQARFRLLLHLRRSGGAGMHPMELAKALGVGRATVTGLVDGVEKAGLARRQACDLDRRAVMVALTRKGERLIDTLAPERLSRISALMGGLSRAEKGRLMSALDKIEAGLPAFRKI
jgi:DNA-binding MarR family transcriptional regulator